VRFKCIEITQKIFETARLVIQGLELEVQCVLLSNCLSVYIAFCCKQLKSLVWQNEWFYSEDNSIQFVYTFECCSALENHSGWK